MQPELTHSLKLCSQRLSLVPFTLELVEAALTDRDLLAQRLGAHIPDDWPKQILSPLHSVLASGPRAWVSQAAVLQLACEQRLESPREFV